MFSSVLIANRGEIAVRIARTLARLGIESVATWTDPDRDAPHTRAADRAVRLGGPRAYLDVSAVVEAAVKAGVDALHPGYGFLSENAELARACADAGVVFIGPPPAAIEAMGDKINARRAVAAAGVPVVPGCDDPALGDAELAAAALVVGLPVLLKPSAGGGGKGMRRVDHEADLPAAIAAARREAQGAFGDATLLVERYLERPRHLEVQVLADRHGTIVALGERECTLQRRHQKVVEEAPSPLLDDPGRRRLGDLAVAAARSCGYEGAGTVEFIVAGARPDEPFFIEMNTRLQVEHPVTEAVLGVDLVEWQVRVAAGQRLPWPSQAEVPAPSGHAVEVRIYAEDPARGFLPSSGRLVALRWPDAAPGLRVDAALEAGQEVGTLYDPMLAKVIVHAPDRPTALGRLRLALGRIAILGVTTNTGFLRRLLADPEVAAGDLDTGLVERRAEALATPEGEQAAVDAADRAWREASGPGPWRLDGWRPAAPPRPARWSLGGRLIDPAGSDPSGCTVALAGDDVWVAREGDTWRVQPARPGIGQGRRGAAGSGRVTSPMPGTVLEVLVAPGDRVGEGQRLVTVEAMKMEHAVTAPAAARVAEVLVTPGAAVALDQPLVVLEDPA
jgi:acetyl-CoA/propionyl-CoA carboxylase biotin carboxyl carrier protein